MADKGLARAQLDVDDGTGRGTRHKLVDSLGRERVAALGQEAAPVAAAHDLQSKGRQAAPC